MFPDTVLTTGRLVLRAFAAEDVDATRAACADEVTQRWLPLPRPYTRDDAVDWCTKTAHALRRSGDGVHFAVTDAADGRLLGHVGLKKTDWRAAVSEVGYWVAPWARGRGVAAEATRAVGRWVLGPQSFQRMELRAAPGNAASLRVAEKAGMVREGVLRNAGFVHAGRVDLVLYALVPQDLADARTDSRSHQGR